MVAILFSDCPAIGSFHHLREREASESRPFHGIVRALSAAGEMCAEGMRERTEAAARARCSSWNSDVPEANGSSEEPPKK